MVNAEANRKTHNPDFSLLSTRIQTHLAHEHLTLEATSFFFFFLIDHLAVAQQFQAAFIHMVEEPDKCSQFEGIHIPAGHRSDPDRILKGKGVLLLSFS